MKNIKKSSKLKNVCYEIRGQVAAEAKRLEDEGHKILKLNIGNPAPFGFEAPDDILKDHYLSGFDYGYDLKTKEYGDLIEMCVIDPTKVTRSALQNAVSVAVTILSISTLTSTEKSCLAANVTSLVIPLVLEFSDGKFCLVYLYDVQEPSRKIESICNKFLFMIH